MAYFAQLDDKNIVTQVVVADSIEWVNDNIGGTWIETAVDGSIRFNYAGIGYTYDPVDDAFIEPYPQCCHDNISLNAKKQWDCPECEALRDKPVAL